MRKKLPSQQRRGRAHLHSLFERRSPTKRRIATSAKLHDRKTPALFHLQRTRSRFELISAHPGPQLDQHPVCQPSPRALVTRRVLFIQHPLALRAPLDGGEVELPRANPHLPARNHAGGEEECQKQQTHPGWDNRAPRMLVRGENASWKSHATVIASPAGLGIISGDGLPRFCASFARRRPEQEL